MKLTRVYFLLAALCLPMTGLAQEDGNVHHFQGQHGAYVAERVVDGLGAPFAIEIMPDGSALVSQREKGSAHPGEF